MGWGGNLDSSMVKSARLVICRFVVQIFLLKNLICNTRHEIYRLNLIYKVRFHLIIIDLNLIFVFKAKLIC